MSGEKSEFIILCNHCKQQVHPRNVNFSPIIDARGWYSISWDCPECGKRNEYERWPGWVEWFKQEFGEMTGETRRTDVPGKVDKLRELIYSFVSDLASLEMDPVEWAPWLVLLCESLETEAMQRHLDPFHPDGVEKTFDRLQDAITKRIKNNGW